VRLADFFITYRTPKPPTHDPTINPDVRDRWRRAYFDPEDLQCIDRQMREA